METLQRQMLLACPKDVMFRRLHNGRGDAGHPVGSKWSENVEVATVHAEMCSREPEVY